MATKNRKYLYIRKYDRYHQTSNGNLSFSTTASSKRVSLGDASNDRQPEMVVETGTSYISGTLTDSVEIQTANLAFSNTTN